MRFRLIHVVWAMAAIALGSSFAAAWRRGQAAWILPGMCFIAIVLMTMPLVGLARRWGRRQDSGTRFIVYGSSPCLFAVLWAVAAWENSPFNVRFDYLSRQAIVIWMIRSALVGLPAGLVLALFMHSESE
jgi:hypothetical protein